MSADFLDDAQKRDMDMVEEGVKVVRERAAKIPVGVPGDCTRCGEPSGRLVGGVCAPCRDKYKLP